MISTFVHRNRTLRHFLQLLYVVLFLGFLQAPKSEAEETNSTTEIAKKFALLWNVFDPPYGEAAIKRLADFQAELSKPTKLSPRALSILKAVSFERGWNMKFAIPDNSNAAALGALYYLQIPLSLKEDKTGMSFIQRDGRMARFLEYGYSQTHYDRGLGGVYYFNLPEAEKKKRWEMPAGTIAVSAPRLSEFDYRYLQRLFTITGDKLWERKALKWRLGLFGRYLISTETAPLWSRLSQLETSTAKELDQIFALASGAKEADLIEKPQETVKAEYSKEQYQQAVQIMLNLAMPWEAYLFLQDHKKASEANPQLMTKVQEAWRHDFVESAKNLEKQKKLNILPWYVAGVRVTSEMTLEEFARQVKLRPNLPK